MKAGRAPSPGKPRSLRSATSSALSDLAGMVLFAVGALWFFGGAGRS
jgi:hypothetical protein